MKTIFQKSQKKQRAYSLPKQAKAFEAFLPPEDTLRQTPPHLPETSELDLTRHFTALASQNMGIDNAFYPLGSCTMKFNPRVNEWAAALPEFVNTHPMAPEETVQGNLKILVELVEILCGISGMTAGTWLPNAGAQGEFTGVKMIAAYHKLRNDLARKEFLIPDDAHGTNPATAAMAGFKTVALKTSRDGDIDISQLKELVSEKTAGLMLTNPNTLGLFSTKILEIAKIVHDKGGLLYYDGANLNPLLYIAKPAAMGFDVMHVNLHKTFSTPHGGGGPGAGPVLCNDLLKNMLPYPRVEKIEGLYRVVSPSSDSIGRMVSFFGNFAILLRAYLYAKLHGQFGLRRIAEHSVLNANYLKKCLTGYLRIPFPQNCMHEFVAQADQFLDKGIKANDIAKRLLDYGMHPPTVYFPLIIKESFLIEPTESESKETLDAFVAAIKVIIREIEENPALVAEAPHTMSVSRLDEVTAARHPVLKDPWLSRQT